LDCVFAVGNFLFSMQRIPTTGSRKRGQKLVWMPITVQVVGEGTSESQGKRQRTGSVFDRLEEQGVEQTGSVFDRLDDPAVDPAQGPPR
jgi:hypothetical protein